MKTYSRWFKYKLLIVLLALIGVCLYFLWREKTMAIVSGPLVLGLRFCVIAGALGGWFISQSLIGTRPLNEGAIGDGIHDLTAAIHRYLEARPKLGSGVLIISSLFVDLFGIFLIGVSIFGTTVRPFVALLILFMLRQVCQAFCALPVPPRMIWRNPGVPSLFVTYGVSNDFFFSGHTAVSILGAVELARIAPLWVGAVAGVIALLEATVVLVLRAHYTMDVIAALFAAYFAIHLSNYIFLFV
jgi:hypothetical protein